MAQIIEPVWIEADLALAIHERQLAERGGPVGVRDASALESALGLARNQWAYGECDLCALAAAYAYGVARLFLALNNEQLGFAPEDAIHVVLALASGSLTEAEVAGGVKPRRS